MKKKSFFEQQQESPRTDQTVSVGQRQAVWDEDSCTRARRKTNTMRAIETETDNLAETATQADTGIVTET